MTVESTPYPEKFTSRKDKLPDGEEMGDWIPHYLTFVVKGIRSPNVTQKTQLHLQRFQQFFQNTYGHDRLATCVKRDVLAWRQSLRQQGLAVSTVNNHLASLSAFTTWVQTHKPTLFPVGDPAKGIGELILPPLEPRALSDAQVRSLKSICDRLYRFHQRKGRAWNNIVEIPSHEHSRSLRDRAIVFVLLSTGLRREELIMLNLEQVDPQEPDRLRGARRARITKVAGKRKSERTVFLSADARLALADYLEQERPRDVSSQEQALFLSASSLSSRRSDGRLSPRAINLILEQIGRWHDADVTDPERKISPLRPHDLRHTFAFQLATVTGADAYELERRLGHRSQRYIQRYTNPPEAIAAQHIEKF
ncbi:integrase domain protein SAM domain protein (plasmid) [Kalymmatonema gypsitolerans NIES-4073]|nr:integrase domain protein SAM domain protein [Scytonema sp. NIES-4073]